MDALNLAQKVYNMLNRIAVSGGTYRDWLETVFTGGNYMERCETPMFEGSMSTEIVFQEVISNSASGEQPLGTLAGRGYDTGKQKGGHIKINVTFNATGDNSIPLLKSFAERLPNGLYRDWETISEIGRAHV